MHTKGAFIETRILWNQCGKTTFNRSQYSGGRAGIIYESRYSGCFSASFAFIEFSAIVIGARDA